MGDDAEKGEAQPAQQKEISTVPVEQEQARARPVSTANTGASQQSVNSPPPRGPIKLDTGYLTTLPALIKIAELVIAIICIGCVGSSIYFFGAHGFFVFVCVAGFLVTATLFILFLLGMVDWINFPWEFIEMMYGVGAALLYLIASITLAVYNFGQAVHIAGAVFGFINMVLYIFGSFWSFQEWRSAGEAAAAQ